MVGVIHVTREDWSRADPAALGRAALPELHAPDPTTLASSFAAAEPPPRIITPRMLAVLREAVELAGEGSVEPLHLLLAALKHPGCVAINTLLGELAEAGIKFADVIEWLQQRAAQPGPDAPDLPAVKPDLPPAPPPGQPHMPPPRVPGRPPAPPAPRGGILSEYGRDLTAEARDGNLHPAIGADALLRRVKRILLLRQANNPLLMGEPGVGKTAIVEGLAYDLVKNAQEVPELASKRIVEIPMLNLVEGTKYRGDLEERVKQLLAEVKANPDIIIFIDEIHTILGSGGESSSNLANHLKPALARGEFPCIGATTISEYRRSIEKDPALGRRFETVLVEEPSVDDCITILKGIKPGLEEHYNVGITDAGIEAAARLSARYVPDEHLPAKAIKLLEQAGAYVKMPSYRASEAEAQQPLFRAVDDALIRYLLARKTGIPLEQLAGGELERIRGMEEALRQQVIGQDEAVSAVAAVIRRARTGLHNPQRPVGVFLFVGPSGVGKTELARALAAYLFHDRDAMIRLDMSEYMEKHQVSRLIGAPPGYVGYEEEGQLTGRLRLHPYSVVLLDEIEKAHDDVHPLFLQLFDEGRLTDAKGRTVDGRDAIFIMTSNLGADIYSHEPLGYATKETQSPAWFKEKHDQVEQVIRARFKPEFRTRIDHIVHFDPLSRAEVARIFGGLFKAKQEQLHAQHGITLTITPEAAAHICEQGYDAANGARPLARAIDRLLVDALTERILDGRIARNDTITVGYDESTARLTFGKAL
jgi:ATP-dependent Clp protease ATP-binding subunit ClpC